MNKHINKQGLDVTFRSTVWWQKGNTVQTGQLNIQTETSALLLADNELLQHNLSTYFNGKMYPFPNLTEICAFPLISDHVTNQ